MKNRKEKAHFLSTSMEMNKVIGPKAHDERLLIGLRPRHILLEGVRD
jgi:hypothetical protein